MFLHLIDLTCFLYIKVWEHRIVIVLPELPWPTFLADCARFFLADFLALDQRIGCDPSVCRELIFHSRFVARLLLSIDRFFWLQTPKNWIEINRNNAKLAQICSLPDCFKSSTPTTAASAILRSANNKSSISLGGTWCPLTLISSFRRSTINSSFWQLNLAISPKKVQINNHN